jgi:hypothetical protein
MVLKLICMVIPLNHPPYTYPATSIETSDEAAALVFKRQDSVFNSLPVVLAAFRTA